MASANGYGKIVTSGSIFSYDVDDFRNSFIGKPGYNVTGTPVAWVGNNDGTYFKTQIGTTIANIPAIGNREVYFVNIFNDYPNSGNCCPSLYRYGPWGITTGVSGNTLYTYSIIYKCESGYTHPNYMYRYEYNGGSYITEVGIFDTSKRIDLGDGWYYAWNTFTTNVNCNTLYLGMWYYQYNVQDTVYLYKAMVTQGDYQIPPEQFIPPQTTRETTQGLLPLISNQTLNLDAVSFDTNAMLTFDGTDDNITTNISKNDLSNNSTFAAVINCSNSVNEYNMYLGQLLPYFGVYVGNSIIYSDYISGVQRVLISSSGTITIGQNHYVVCTREYDGSNTTLKIYIDGVLEVSQTHAGAASDIAGDKINIGDGQTANWYPFFGYVYNVTLYNRTLSENEIQQNYQQYKTRFNLA